MSKEEIIKKAKVIVFPSNENTYGVNDDNYVLLSLNATRYVGFQSNEHHFTTEYHYKEVLPKIDSIFHFGFNIDDWNKVSNIINKNNKKFDLSYLKPKIDKSFIATDLINDVDYRGNFNILRFNDNVKKLTWTSEYHKLYAFPHWCSRIVNMEENNGRKLLVIGDSQMIPSITILCYYYKEVWYIDNRYNNNIYDKYMKNEDFDDVLIGYWGSRKDIKFYTRYIR